MLYDSPTPLPRHRMPRHCARDAAPTPHEWPNPALPLSLRSPRARAAIPGSHGQARPRKRCGDAGTAVKGGTSSGDLMRSQNARPALSPGEAKGRCGRLHVMLQRRWCAGHVPGGDCGAGGLAQAAEGLTPQGACSEPRRGSHPSYPDNRTRCAENTRAGCWLWPTGTCESHARLVSGPGGPSGQQLLSRDLCAPSDERQC